MLSQLLQPEIRSLIDERKLSTLKEILSDWTPTDIAELLSELNDNEQVIIYRLLPPDLATDTFEYMDFDTQMALLKAMGKEEVASVLNEMSPDDRTALLEELPGAAARQLISLLSAEERRIALTLLGYPENSVGRLMTPNYIAVKPDWTITETLDNIREHGRDSETLNTIYVVDNRGKLVDDVKIRDILLAPLESRISDLMDENFIVLNVNDDQESAVDMFKKYDRVALPVVDHTGLLIGIVTIDDVLDVAEEEATEDIQKIGAVQALEEPYSTVPLFTMIKKRAFWLGFLFIGGMFTTTALAAYEDAVSKAVILTLFIPLIIASGGNSGSQAATLVIRALSLKEVTLRDWWFVMRREVLSGLTLGGILALIGILRIYIWHLTGFEFGTSWFLMSMTVGLSLIGIVLWGSLAGSMLPFILKRVGIDPAASSAPLVSTLVDVTGIIIYFSVAYLILGSTLLS
jgi:magnesium transporter